MTEDRCNRDQPAHLSRDQGTLSLRRRAAGDDARIVEIYGEQEADSEPLTIERYREEHAGSPSDRQSEQWVALDSGHVVGVGSIDPGWWTGQPGIYAIDLRIDRSRWRQGIGSKLYDQLRSRLIALEATRLLGWVRADAVHGRRFADLNGFRETGVVVEEYRLHVPDAGIDAYVGLEERLRRSGLTIASLAELGTEDEVFLRALYRLWTGAGDEASGTEQSHIAFQSWQREVLHAPGLSPDTHWVALDGERPVGMTFLKRLSDDAAENDYTAVEAAYRGRGIAPALKLQAIAWARQQGVRWFYTSSEIGNMPMIAVNRRLGYQPGVRRLELARDFP